MNKGFAGIENLNMQGHNGGSGGGKVMVSGQRFVQGNHRLFLFIAKASQIVGRAEPDVYRVVNGVEQGYQRMPERPRGLAFASFLETGLRRGEVVVPGTILLAHRGEINAWKDDGGIWRIELPEKLYVVDGQHRLLGLKIAIEERNFQEAAELEIPVLLIEKSTELLEAELFRVINETAKKVRTDLARRILALKLQKQSLAADKNPLYQKRSWEVTATRIIDILGKESESVWFGRIQLPNEPKRSTHIIRDKSFGDSLRPLLKDHPFAYYKPETLARGINEFWLGVKKLMDEAPDRDEYPHPFEKPDEYVLLKAIPGVFALHLVLRYLWTVWVNQGRQGPITADYVFEALKAASERADADAHFGTRAAWARDSVFSMYGGLKGATGLANLIIANLREAGYLLDWEEEGAE